MANVRDRSLLDLAHEVHECTNCERYVVEGCEPAHRNGLAAGKGMSIKSSDAQVAALCHECHRFYDTGGNCNDPTNRYLPTRNDKQEMWLAAYFKTMDLYWKNGWIRVV